MTTNCENTKLSDSAFVRLIGEIILIKHYNHLIIMSIKSNVKCHGMSNVKWQKQHEMSCNLRSLSPMSWCLGSQWRDKNSSSPERRAGAEKNLVVLWQCHTTVIMSNVQCPLQSCPLSSVQSSLSQWQSPAMLRIARQARRREWGSNILLHLAWDSCPVQCCPM